MAGNRRIHKPFESLDVFRRTPNLAELPKLGELLGALVGRGAHRHGDKPVQTGQTVGNDNGLNPRLLVHDNPYAR